VPNGIVTSPFFFAFFLRIRKGGGGVKRRLLDVLTALSGTLFSVCVTLWILSHITVLVGSYFTQHQNGPRWESRHYLFRNIVGELELRITDYQGPVRYFTASFIQIGKIKLQTYAFIHQAVSLPDTTAERLGFFAQNWTGSRPTRDKRYVSEVQFLLFAVPHWFPCLVFAILPAVRAMRSMASVRSTRRIGRGCCPRCGYDLRATPERCPECGAMPLSAKGVAT
jgi:hypothetical protein